MKPTTISAGIYEKRINRVNVENPTIVTPPDVIDGLSSPNETCEEPVHSNGEAPYEAYDRKTIRKTTRRNLEKSFVRLIWRGMSDRPFRNSTTRIRPGAAV